MTRMDYAFCSVSMAIGWLLFPRRSVKVAVVLRAPDPDLIAEVMPDVVHGKVAELWRECIGVGFAMHNLCGRPVLHRNDRCHLRREPQLRSSVRVVSRRKRHQQRYRRAE